MDTFSQPLMDEIHHEANFYCERNQVIPIHYQGYLSYEINGERREFESEYFGRRKQLAVLALSAHDQQNRNVIDCLENVIWEICNEITWAVPAHLSAKFFENGGSTYPCVDLFAAETAQALSEICYYLKDDLNSWLIKRVKHEIESRIFNPFLDQKWFWESSGNNWSAVIAGAVGMSALYLLKKNALLQSKILKKVDLCLNQYLDSFGDDGACLEGIGYWAYGFGYYLYFAILYAEIFQDTKYLSKSKVPSIASFPFLSSINDQQYVMFSDYTESIIPTGLLTKIHELFGVDIPSVLSPNKLDDDHCYRFAHIFRNVEWAKRYKTQKIGAVTTYFADAQWVIVKEKNQAFLAVKGGSNEESHNHNDVGHFMMGIGNNIFLTDLGAGEYVKSYFQNKRYDFLPTSSRGHSVPIINGYVQRPGAYGAQNVVFD